MTARSVEDSGRSSRLVRLRVGLSSAFPDEPNDADRVLVTIAGLRMPLRTTVAIAIATLAVLFDYSRTFIPPEIQAIGREAPAIRYQALERVVVFIVVPLLVVLLAFRDDPRRYGLRLGDWRWGASLTVLGCAVMTPIVLAIAQHPQFRTYYAVSWAPLGYILTTNVIDLVATEFLMRGFLQFSLVRGLGPIGVLIATLPFVFAHLGKPEIELFSTLGGGLVFGWLNWRTGSILWSALGHIYVLTLVMAAVGPPTG
ncbi:MAG TPA: CPBP family intramembrane glutamic endopeptidase [Candidatus Limnocylindrales bacterium]